MKTYTKQFLNVVPNIILALFMFLAASSFTYAQENLTPGKFGNFYEYERVLQRVFLEAYQPQTRARVMTKTKYGTEQVTGIRSDTSGYQLFHMIPEQSIWHSGWRNVPCLDDEGNELPEDSGRTCSNLNFSSIDSIPVNTYRTPIDTTLATKLLTLWQEMMVRSTYQQLPFMSTGGVVYQFSTALFNVGMADAYIQNPERDTFTGRFASISVLMRQAARAETEALADSLVNEIYEKTSGLLGDLHAYGNTLPRREIKNRTLRGCDNTNRYITENIYCWEANLSDAETPYLIIANKPDDEYVFELIDISKPDELNRVHILPVLSIHRPFVRDDRFSGWQNYLLQPYDITELRTNTRKYQTHISGYKDFVLENESIAYDDKTVIIRFDGLFAFRDERMLVKVEGDPDWFTVPGIFEAHEE